MRWIVLSHSLWMRSVDADAEIEDSTCLPQCTTGMVGAVVFLTSLVFVFAYVPHLHSKTQWTQVGLSLHIHNKNLWWKGRRHSKNTKAHFVVQLTWPKIDECASVQRWMKEILQSLSFASLSFLTLEYHAVAAWLTTTKARELTPGKTYRIIFMIFHQTNRLPHSERRQKVNETKTRTEEKTAITRNIINVTRQSSWIKS